MAQMQVAVRLRRKTRNHAAAMAARSAVVTDQRANEVIGDRRFRGHD
jgi:hypothetical protein